MFSQQSVGRRPRKKRKNHDHPEKKKHTNTSIPSHPPVFRQYNHHSHLGFTQQHPTSPWLTFSVLYSCANILNCPIQLTLCGKMICMDCFVAHMKGGSGVGPGCSSHHEHSIDNIQSPPDVVKLIGGLYIRCKGPACQQYVQLQNLADHLASGYQQHLHLTQQLDNCFHKVHTLQPQQLKEGLPPVW